MTDLAPKGIPGIIRECKLLIVRTSKLYLENQLIENKIAMLPEV